jgi:hypothetical protein
MKPNRSASKRADLGRGVKRVTSTISPGFQHHVEMESDGDLGRAVEDARAINRIR